MINISQNQISDYFKDSLHIKKIHIPRITNQMFTGKYKSELENIFMSVKGLEDSLNLKNLLTSSKLWELIVAEKLGHSVNSEQGGRAGAHDAHDNQGRWYEYKINQSIGWSFQDISDAVLRKYVNLEAFILAVVDKPNFKVKEVYRAEAKPLIAVVKAKRDEKAREYKSKGKEVRREQVTVGRGELDLAKAKRIL
jgi:hypothetical protein